MAMTDRELTCPRCGERKDHAAQWCPSCTDWQERYDEAPDDTVTSLASQPNVVVPTDAELRDLYEWMRRWRHPDQADAEDRAAHDRDDDLRAWSAEELREAFGR